MPILYHLLQCNELKILHESDIVMFNFPFMCALIHVLVACDDGNVRHVVAICASSLVDEIVCGCALTEHGSRGGSTVYHHVACAVCSPVKFPTTQIVQR